MKGTQWVTKTPRLHCPCGRVVHMEGKGKWRLVVDSAPSEKTLSISQPIDAVDEQEPPPRAEDDSDG
jgi:hypothetical protein